MNSWQNDWAYNKYYVMSKSQNMYNQIRNLASNNNWNDEKEKKYQKLIYETEQLTPTISSLKNTYQHVWGYFKKRCTKEEKNNYMRLINKVTLEDDELAHFLKDLTYKYEVKYLINSRLIKEIK